jgi:hypothetical protein
MQTPENRQKYIDEEIISHMTKLLQQSIDDEVLPYLKKHSSKRILLLKGEIIKFVINTDDHAMLAHIKSAIEGDVNVDEEVDDDVDSIDAVHANHFS